MKLEEFRGNEKKVKELVDWLDIYFHSKQKGTSPFVVIFSRTGNGKTTLVQALADSYNVDLYRITTDDIRTTKDFNNCVKSLNLERLDGKNAKIVLFEDFYEISYFRAKIIELCNLGICKYPIIVTMDRYPVEEELRKGLVIELAKPRTSQLIELLKFKQRELGFNYDDETLRQIAIDSPSVRSAINALYTGVASKRNSANIGLLDIRKQLVQRGLQQDLREYPNKPYLITTLTKNMNCYTSDGFKVLRRFTFFDYEIKARFLSVDKFLVNNMKEPIEKIAWFKNEWKSSKERPKQKKPKIKPKQKTVKEKEEIKHTDISDFL